MKVKLWSTVIGALTSICPIAALWMKVVTKQLSSKTMSKESTSIDSAVARISALISKVLVPIRLLSLFALTMNSGELTVM